MMDPPCCRQGGESGVAVGVGEGDAEGKRAELGREVGEAAGGAVRVGVGAGLAEGVGAARVSAGEVVTADVWNPFCSTSTQAPRPGKRTNKTNSQRRPVNLLQSLRR